MTFRIESFQRLLPAACLLAVAVTVTACGGDRPFFSGPVPAAPAGPALEPFSGERAWAHLVALSDLGPRPVGSTANQEALEYIRSRLEELDVELIDLPLDITVVQEPTPLEGEDEEAGAEAEETEEAEEAEAAAPAGPALKAHHLVARIPADSPDSILLMAHYDTGPGTPGANDGASGPALLLELTRQLSERPLPYTVEVAFLDNEMATLPEDPTRPLLIGSRLFTGHLLQSGTLDVIRLAVSFRQVGDAELAIGRDLHSHRIHRETFFETAADLGLAHAFPTDRGFVEVVSTHRSFVAAGMPRVVSILDPVYGGEEPPGEYWGGEDDVREHCSPESLETVGVVTLAALRRISEQLQKIDLVSGRAERRRAEALAPPEIEGEAVEEPSLVEDLPSGGGAVEPMPEAGAPTSGETADETDGEAAPGEPGVRQEDGTGAEEMDEMPGEEGTPPEASEAAGESS